MNKDLKYNTITLEWYAEEDVKVFFLIWASHTDYIHINWGDNNNEQYKVDSNNMEINEICNKLDNTDYSPFTSISHQYQHSGIYNITITTPRYNHIAFSNHNELSSYLFSQYCTSLNTKLAPDLGALVLKRVKMKKFDVSKNKKLRLLNCEISYGFKTLDISKNKDLKSLSCSHCGLNELHLGNINIETIDCSNNRLTYLDLSSNKNLCRLIAYNNNLIQLDLNKNTKLTELDVQHQKTRLHKDPFSKSNNECYKWKRTNKGSFSNLSINGCMSLEIINIKNQSIEYLDLSGNKNLLQLDCSGNNITNLDITKNQKLKNLDCSNNKLEELDISKNINLTSIKIIGNKIKSLYSIF